MRICLAKLLCNNVLLSLILLTVSPTAIGYGADWFVDGSHTPDTISTNDGRAADPFRSIQQAIGSRQTRDGDRIIVMPMLQGYSGGTIIVDKAVTIVAYTPDLDPLPAEPPPPVHDGEVAIIAQSRHHAIKILSDGVTIEGLYIHSADGCVLPLDITWEESEGEVSGFHGCIIPAAGIYVERGVSDCIIQHNEFGRVNGGINSVGIYIYGGIESSAEQVGNNTIEDNVFFSDGVDNTHIYLNSARGNMITNNQFSGRVAHGIELLHSSDNQIVDNVITTTANDNSDQVGIYISSLNPILANALADESSSNSELPENGNPYLSTGNWVAENTCSGMKIGIQLDGAQENVIISNPVVEGNEHGIVLKESSKNFIRENECNNNNSTGILLEASHGNFVINNTCQNNYHGIYLIASDDNSIEQENTLSHNMSNGLTLSFSSNNMVKEGNIFDGNLHGIDLNGIDLTAMDGNLNTDFESPNRPGMRPPDENGLGGDNGYIDISEYPHKKSTGNTIENNRFTNNAYGIYISYSESNTVTRNEITDSTTANLFMAHNDSTYIYFNILSPQIQSVESENVMFAALEEDHIYEFNNVIYHQRYGNYYRGHTSQDQNGDGICDTPYINIRGGIRDEYPLCSADIFNRYSAGRSEVDSDGDGTVDADDQCPTDPNKTTNNIENDGVCPCGMADSDLNSDGDGAIDCLDGCPDDADKEVPGVCGCGIPDTDSDEDGVKDCEDGCPNDALKVEPGICGCGLDDSIDSDRDGTLDCEDRCPQNSLLTEPEEDTGCESIPYSRPEESAPKDDDRNGGSGCFITILKFNNIL